MPDNGKRGCNLENALEFILKYRIINEENCWLWKRGRNKAGYGTLRVKISGKFDTKYMDVHWKTKKDITIIPPVNR